MTSSVEWKCDRLSEFSHSSPYSRWAVSSCHASHRLRRDRHTTRCQCGSWGCWDATRTSCLMAGDGRRANWSSTATTDSDGPGPRSILMMRRFRSRLSPEGTIEDLLQSQRNRRLSTCSTRTWISPGRSPEKLRFEDHQWTSFYIDQTLVGGECSVGCLYVYSNLVERQ